MDQPDQGLQSDHPYHLHHYDRLYQLFQEDLLENLSHYFLNVISRFLINQVTL